VPNMGFGDWAIVLVLVLLLFGAKRLPELARSLGQSMNAFKKGMQDGLQDGEKKENEVSSPNRGTGGRLASRKKGGKKRGK